jgi:pyridoxine kinase
MRFLSIQSHVAYGYVGNRAATFPLQRLGHEVWAVNTVQFSNHTGYGSWRGSVMPAEQVRDVLAGIEALGVLPRCHAVLSGYLGDATLGAIVLDAVAHVRRANPAALWCCDPVIGDVDRGIFVRPGIVELFRDEALPQADIATPNRFELEILTGREVRTLDEAISAADQILALGPRLVLVTSLDRRDGPAETIEMLAVSRAQAWLIATPLLPFAIAPNGTGDAVAALFTAHLMKSGDPGAALGETASSIWGVLEATARSSERELQLVAAQEELVAPRRRFTAQAIAVDPGRLDDVGGPLPGRTAASGPR